MSAIHPVDTLIVGQGLAGSLLAWHLLERGRTVIIVDDGHATSSSKVAAGLLNPVAGRRLAKTPRVDWLLPQALTCYRHLESVLGQRLFFPRELRRLFRSPDEHALWDRRAADPAYQTYLDARSDRGCDDPRIRAPRGCGRQRSTGYVDMARLLRLLRDTFRRAGIWRRATVEPRAMDIRENGVVWDDLHARRLIFCEGYRVRDNPWFGWLPLQPARGEILTLAHPTSPPARVLTAAHWLLPLEGALFRVGATFDRERIDLDVTEGGRSTLMQALDDLVVGFADAEVISHQAGVRPGTPDRAPFLGLHPECPALGVCNGFGARGSLLIPGYAACFADVLTGHGRLPAEADIRRYWPG